MKDDGASKLIREIAPKYAKKMLDTKDMKAAKDVGIVCFFVCIFTGKLQYLIKKDLAF